MRKKCRWLIIIILITGIFIFSSISEENVAQNQSVTHSSKIGSIAVMESNSVRVNVNEIKEFHATLFIRNGSLLDNKEVIIEVTIDSILPISIEYPQTIYVNNDGFGIENISFIIDYTSEDIESGRYTYTSYIKIIYSINGTVFEDIYEFHGTVVLENVTSAELLLWAEAGVLINWFFFTVAFTYMRERKVGRKKPIINMFVYLAISIPLSLVIFLQFLRQFHGDTYAISVLSAFGVGFFWHAGLEGMGKGVIKTIRGGDSESEKNPKTINEDTKMVSNEKQS